MAQYVRHGHSGKKQADLVVADNVRRASLTRQLMINRLANNVLSEMPPVLPPARRAAPSRKRGAKVRRGSAGMPVAASVAAIICAFSLGTFFSRPPAEAVTPHQSGQAILPGAPVAAAEAREAAAPAADDVPIANRPTEYRVADFGRFSAA
ncbi:MAG: hypothetical protein FJZ01_27985, partial [Candidatus Sericytochromatia bacterium]|nr:hypothetical protein [Candidatus Tanganyikabacteria bacterium]